MFKEHSNQIVKSSEVIGVSVINAEKENLGKIEEIVIDKITGEVHYVVLSFDGIFNFANKYFAFPWKSISYDPAEESFILNVSKEKLKNADGFDKNQWPNFSDEKWRKNLKDFTAI